MRGVVVDPDAHKQGESRDKGLGIKIWDEAHPAKIDNGFGLRILAIFFGMKERIHTGHRDLYGAHLSSVVPDPVAPAELWAIRSDVPHQCVSNLFDGPGLTDLLVQSRSEPVEVIEYNLMRFHDEAVVFPIAEAVGAVVPWAMTFALAHELHDLGPLLFHRRFTEKHALDPEMPQSWA